MIDIKQIAKPKSGGSGGSSSKTTSYIVKSSEEAKHATRADKADYADKSAYADSAGQASRATYADKAFDLDADSPVADKFISSVNDDEADGHITFNKGLTSLAAAVLKAGLTVGDAGKYGITAEGVATLAKVLAELIKATSVEADTVKADTANIGEIRTDFLTVTKAAHFFKLVIDEIKSTEGIEIQTQAHCTLDAVEAYDADGNVIADGDTTTAVHHWRCYWKAKDGDGKAITNKWQKYDQAICYTCNLAEGTSYDTTTQYWWRLVEGVSASPVTISIDGTDYECHYIDISNTTYDTGKYTGDIKSGTPQVEDNVAQLGWRGTNNDGDIRDDEARAGAQIRASYKTPDRDLESPSTAQYHGITDFNLSSHRYTWLAANGNKIAGDIELASGEDFTSYVHYAYANTLTPTDTATPDGTQWTKGDAGGYAWIYTGVIANHTKEDDKLSFNDYSWQRTLGDDGKDGQDTVLVVIRPTTNMGSVIKNNTGSVTLKAYVYVGGKLIENLSPSRYQWYRTSDSLTEDGKTDDAWHSEHSGVGDTISVSAAEVTGAALIECEIKYDTGLADNTDDIVIDAVTGELITTSNVPDTLTLNATSGALDASDEAESTVTMDETTGVVKEL